ncbi:Clr5 domain-containing protein, partial [Leptodontidium sp. 2 PMI_412]
MSSNLVELRQYSDDEWERMRLTISSLYSTRKLEVVVTIMKTEHGFGATKDMYKKKFRKWGLQKYRPRAARPSIYRAKDANEKVNDLLLCVKSFFLATLYPGKIYLDNADPHRHLTSTLSLAFDCFRVGEQCMGGRSLRAAFLQLEPIIT